MRLTTPRIAPVPAESWTDEQREIVEPMLARGINVGAASTDGAKGSLPTDIGRWHWADFGSFLARPRMFCDETTFHAAGPAGRKAMASISIFAFSNRPATCTAVLVGGSFGKNSPRMRENTA